MKRFVSVIALIFFVIVVCNAQTYDFGDYKVHHSMNSIDTVICGACNYTGNCFGWNRFKKIKTTKNWNYYQCTNCGAMYSVCRHMHWCYCSTHIVRIY